MGEAVPARRSRARAAIRAGAALLPGLALALALAGCGAPGPGSGNPGGSTARTPPATSPPATSGSRPGSTFRPGGRRTPPPAPPVLDRPGATASLPPPSRLPPPRAEAGPVAELEARWGFRIGGAGASRANLEVLERALQDLRAEQAAGLARIDFPLVQGVQSLQGLWQSDGRSAEIRLYAQTGMAKQVHLHTASHELAHHVSLQSREAWGRRLEAALGSSPAHQPSPYSRTQPAENLAENIAFALLGSDSEERPLPGWRPSARVKELLREEYGARVKLGPAPQ